MTLTLILGIISGLIGLGTWLTVEATIEMETTIFFASQVTECHFLLDLTKNISVLSASATITQWRFLIT
jgi:hypothetical protein